jgi:hypothetical protein
MMATSVSDVYELFLKDDNTYRMFSIATIQNIKTSLEYQKIFQQDKFKKWKPISLSDNVDSLQHIKSMLECSHDMLGNRHGICMSE